MPSRRARRLRPHRRRRPTTSEGVEPASESPPPGHPRGPGGLDTDALRRSWPDVLEWLSRNKRVTWTFVSQNAQVADYDGERVLLSISTVGLAETFRRGAHADYVRQALIDVLGVDARIEGVPSDDPAPAPRSTTPPSTAPSTPAPSGSGATPTPPRDSRLPGPARLPRTQPDSSGQPGAGDPPSEPDLVPRSAGARAGGAAGAGAGATADAGATAGGPPAGGRPASGYGPSSWSDAPPPPETAPSWASPLEQARATVADEPDERAEHVVDDSAISDADESIDDLTDVGVPVVERILGGTVIGEESR